jgi:Bacterial Ig-like domain (group 3)/FG-GAP-like repeat/Carboxypeptidase regulatory-like domain
VNRFFRPCLECLERREVLTSTGLFTPLTPFVQTNVAPQLAAVGRGDADSGALLAVADASSVTLLRSDSAGTFSVDRTVTFSSGQTPVSVAVGDFNGDGYADLAVGVQSQDAPNLLEIDYTNPSDLKHSVIQDVPLSSVPLILTAGNLYNDGVTDLAVGLGSPSQNSLFAGATELQTFGKGSSANSLDMKDSLPFQGENLTAFAILPAAEGLAIVTQDASEGIAGFQNHLEVLNPDLTAKAGLSTDISTSLNPITAVIASPFPGADPSTSAEVLLADTSSFLGATSRFYRIDYTTPAITEQSSTIDTIGLTTVPGPTPFAAADFDGDGNFDFAVAQESLVQNQQQVPGNLDQQPINSDGNSNLRNVPQFTLAVGLSQSDASLVAAAGTPLSVGTNFPVAVLSADVTNDASGQADGNPALIEVDSAGTIRVYVTPARATLALGADPVGGSTYGQAVTFTAVVSGATTLPDPTGNVEFFDGSTPLGLASLAPVTGAPGTSVAFIQLPNLGAGFLSGGTYSIRASYGGDASHRAALDMSLSYTVAKQQTVIGLATSKSAVASGEQFFLTAIVAATVPGDLAVPTGSVQFTDSLDGTMLPATLSPVTAPSGSFAEAVASVPVTLSTVGTHTFQAVYVPGTDPNYKSSTSANLPQIVSSDTTVTDSAPSANTFQAITFPDPPDPKTVPDPIADAGTDITTALQEVQTQAASSTPDLASATQALATAQQALANALAANIALQTPINPAALTTDAAQINPVKTTGGTSNTDSISGTLTDVTDSSQVGGVRIMLQPVDSKGDPIGTPQWTTTDSTGHFEFDNLPPNTSYQLRAEWPSNKQVEAGSPPGTPYKLKSDWPDQKAVEAGSPPAVPFQINLKSSRLAPALDPFSALAVAEQENEQARLARENRAREQVFAEMAGAGHPSALAAALALSACGFPTLSRWKTDRKKLIVPWTIS